MVVRMRATRSHRDNRRSHHALTATRAAACECGALRVPHRACSACGKYNGKIIIDVVERAKREARRNKRREKDLRAAGQPDKKETKQEDQPAKK